jgi:hypothetical protein
MSALVLMGWAAFVSLFASIPFFKENSRDER